MEEITALHSLNLEWGCVTNLLDKIISIEDKIEGGWPELIDMVADSMTEEGEKKDPVSVFFNLYGFMFRLYYRIKYDPVRQPFNRASYNEKNKLFTIDNYDYKTFVWAIDNGLSGGISNSHITIPEEKLSKKQIERLKMKCK